MKMKDRRKSVHSFSGLLSSLSIANWLQGIYSLGTTGESSPKKEF